VPALDPAELPVALMLNSSPRPMPQIELNQGDGLTYADPYRALAFAV